MSTCKREKITPKRASYYLKENGHNRRPSQVVVDQYAHAMTRGEWMSDNGQTIVLSGRKLIDGQHRLLAIIQSGIPQTLQVVRGVSLDAFATVDTGNRRMLKDVLSIATNEKHPAVVASAVNAHSAYTQHGVFSARLRRHAATYGEQLEYAEQNKQIYKSVKFVCSFKEKAPLSKGHLAALHALFSEKDKDLADTYITKLITGTNIRGKDPVRVVRQKLLDDAQRRTSALKPAERCVVVALGWNSTRNGTPLRRIQVSARGQNKARTVEIE